MAYLITENLKIKRFFPKGGGSHKITSNPYSFVKINKEKTYAGEISFISNCTSWFIPAACKGMGKMIGTNSDTKINGKNTIKSTEKGLCMGVATFFPGLTLPCYCICEFEKDNKNVEHVKV